MPTFGQTCLGLIDQQAATVGRKLSRTEVITILDEQHRQAMDEALSALKPPRKPPGAPRKRNELLDGLVAACGGDPETLTRPGFSAAAVALTDIKAVCPDLTVAEIEARAAEYKRKHKDWSLTPAALAKWWSDVGGGPKTRVAMNDIYQQPENWRKVLQELYGLSDDGVADKEWLELGPDTRKSVLEKIRKMSAASA